MNIWRTRQVIEKLKTLCRSVLMRCSTENKTRQRIFPDTAPLTIRDITISLFSALIVEQVYYACYRKYNCILRRNKRL